MNFYIVDAFTEKPFGGNTAGVVVLEPEAAFPDEAVMQQVAAELRYSETAFVRREKPPKGAAAGPAEFSVRYFTPRYEVALCGHATIAAFGVLFREGIVPAGAKCINHTLAGDLEVVPGPQIMMQMAAPQHIQTMHSTELLTTLRKAMGGLQPDALAPLPVEIISTGLPDLILPVRDSAVLQKLQPDMEALSALSGQLDVVGVHVYALSPEEGSTTHVRNFAPRCGVPEESATGTANAALTYYLYRQGLIRDGAECAFIQGEAMSRPSRVHTKLTFRNGRPDIRVGGPCAIVARGEILTEFENSL